MSKSSPHRKESKPQILETFEAESSNHPIAKAIDQFDQALRDIEASIRLLLPTVIEDIKKRGTDAISQMDRASEGLDSKNLKIRAAAYADYSDAVSRLERIHKSQIPQRCTQSLFIGMFSAYDAFIGELIKIKFTKKAELLDTIKSDLKAHEVLKAASIDEIKEKILREYIDDIRRKSYADQFATLEGILNIPLRKFENWPKFIECSQRRNLITHCGGSISHQYIKVCQENGYKFKEHPKVGEIAEINGKYFIDSAKLLREVGIKLAHTIWRKLFESEIQQSETHLTAIVFDCLSNGRWSEAEILGEFAYNQKNHGDDQSKAIKLINYCIALKQTGKTSEMEKLLQSTDFSGSMPEFRLAKFVLLNQPKDAASIMIAIGKEGEIINEPCYHTWPLFREFRATTEFQTAYKKVYGYSFIRQLKADARKRRDKANATPAGGNPEQPSRAENKKTKNEPAAK